MIFIYLTLFSFFPLFSSSSPLLPLTLASKHPYQTNPPEPEPPSHDMLEAIKHGEPCLWILSPLIHTGYIARVGWWGGIWNAGR